MGVATSASGQVVINEIRIEQPGPDIDEYVELRGTPGTNLAGYSYVVIGNDDGQFPPEQNGYVEEVISLSGTIPASGVFVVAKSSFSLGTEDLTAAFTFEVGNNKTHLLVQGFTGGVGDDLDTNDDGTLDSTPWASLSDSVALIQFPNPDGTSGDFVYSTTTIGPDAGVIPSHVWRCSDTDEWMLGFFIVGLSDTPGEENPLCEGRPAPILISEIRADQTGTDNDEYFELSGSPGASLDGLTYIVIGDGAGALGSGVIECIVDLSSFSISSDGLFLVAEDSDTLGVIADYVTATAILNFENTDNCTHMLVRDFTGALDDDLDTDNNGTLDVQPWSEVLDSVALIIQANPPASTEWAYGTTFVGPDGTFAPGHAYRCQPNGDWRIGRFNPGKKDAADTPGSANITCEACGVIGSGNCFVAHDTPGCQQGDCCEEVCKIDPECCTVVWDALCATSAGTTCIVPGSPPAVVINEVRIDEPGTDLNEYIELRGTPGASLNGVSYVVIGRSAGDEAGVVESVTSLDGSTMTSNGRFLIAKPTFTLGTAHLVVPSSGFFFGSDSAKTHLLVWNVQTIRGEDLDPNNDCSLDQQGWVSIMDQVALRASKEEQCTYGTPLLDLDCNGFAAAHFYRCLRTDEWTIGAFGSFANDTPDLPNASCDAEVPSSCGDDCAGDCLTAHEGTSCSNRTCCEVVCAVDPSCCATSWDASCAALAAASPACSLAATEIAINEVRVDEPGSDVDEYFELIGTPDASLDGLTYVVLGDSSTPDLGSGVIEAIVALDGFALDSNGRFLATEVTFTLSGRPDLQLKGNGLNFENTDNVTHMLVRGFTGRVDDDVDADDDGVIDAKAPWEEVLDSIAIVSTTAPIPSGSAEWWYGARVGPDAVGHPGHIWRCSPTGYWQIGLWDPFGGDDTPGAENAECPGFVGCVIGADRDGNGCVNGADLSIVLGQWDPTGSEGHGYGAGDANCNGVVDGSDLAVILGNWQPICP